MHPFSLTEDEVQQVSGGASLIIKFPGGGTVTSMMYGEEGGGIATTLALGEEGGGIATTMALGEEGGSALPNDL